MGRKLATSFPLDFDEIPCVCDVQTGQCTNLKAAANRQLCTIVLLVEQTHSLGVKKVPLAHPRCSHGGFKCPLQAEAKLMH